MTGEPFVPVGRVIKTHGLKGELSVAEATEAPLSLLVGLEFWFVSPSDRVRNATLQSVRQGPKGTLALFDAVKGIDEAAQLTGRDLLVRAEDLPEEWYAASEEEEDVVGWRVVAEVEGDLGEIVEIIETGANEVWVVEGPLGEVLLPVIDDVVLEFDDEHETIRVRLLDGLLPGSGDEE